MCISYIFPHQKRQYCWITDTETWDQVPLKGKLFIENQINMSWTVSHWWVEPNLPPKQQEIKQKQTLKASRFGVDATFGWHLNRCTITSSESINSTQIISCPSWLWKKNHFRHYLKATNINGKPEAESSESLGAARQESSVPELSLS